MTKACDWDDRAGALLKLPQGSRLTEEQSQALDGLMDMLIVALHGRNGLPVRAHTCHNVSEGRE